ncbi:MAG: hypothetical protein HYT78_03180 [Deltaproteobacteria bacterium]|nr:hypothetical protein [Deltaproteobacteria bacterium]
MAEPNEGQKLTPAEFVKKAILSLRKDPYKGIHSVYSGFNEAFRAYFNEDPVKWTNQLASEGAVELRPARGGIMLYLPGDAPARSTGKEVLKKMGL